MRIQKSEASPASRFPGRTAPSNRASARPGDSASNPLTDVAASPLAPIQIAGGQGAVAAGTLPQVRAGSSGGPTPPRSPQPDPPPGPESVAGSMVGGLTFGLSFGMVGALSAPFLPGTGLLEFATRWGVQLVLEGKLDIATALKLAQFAGNPAVQMAAAGVVAGSVGFALGAWVWKEV